MIFFDILGLKPRFDIDEEALEKAYFAKQRLHHPDKIAMSDKAARAKAVQVSMQLNDAYETLKNPLKRAEYLLISHQVIAANDHATISDPALLMQMMALREQMDEAANNPHDLLQCLEDTQKLAQQSLASLQSAFSAEDFSAAKTAYLQLQYLHKAIEQAHILLY
jgi:molecular chaperone HscB